MGMLMCFQRLVELQESTRILMDLSATGHNPNHTYAELKVQSPRGCGFRSPSTLQILGSRQTQLAASRRMSQYHQKFACCLQQTIDFGSPRIQKIV